MGGNGGMGTGAAVPGRGRTRAGCAGARSGHGPSGGLMLCMGGGGCHPARSEFPSLGAAACPGRAPRGREGGA